MILFQYSVYRVYSLFGYKAEVIIQNEFSFFISKENDLEQKIKPKDKKKTTAGTIVIAQLTAYFYEEPWILVGGT